MKIRALIYRRQSDEVCGVCGEKAFAARMNEPADLLEANTASYVYDGPSPIVRGHRVCVLKHVLKLVGVEVHDSVDGMLYRNGKYVGLLREKAVLA